MVGLLLALTVQTHCLDRFHLRYLAARDSLPKAAVQAIAAEESACNLSPRLRGHHCWYPGHHERNCEVGRFQIKPSTGAARCPGLDIWTYRGNTECFLRMFRQDYARGGHYAITRQNPSPAYWDRVRLRAGTLLLEDP